MATSYQEMKRTLDLYRRAMNVVQDATSSEVAAKRAMTDARKLRDKVDDAFAEMQRDREVGDNRHGVFGSVDGRTDSPEIRALARPVDPSLPMQQKVSIPLTRESFPLAVGDSSNTYGSYAVPTGVLDSIMTGLLDESAILPIARKIPTATGNPLVVPTLATDITADYREEGQPADLGTPVLGKAALSAYNIAGAFQVTAEFLQDVSGADALVGDLAGRCLGQKLALELAVGLGTTGLINGLFTAATSRLTAAQANTFSADELLELRSKINGANRRRAVWVVSDEAELQIVRMKDGESRYLFQPAIAVGQPDTLFGNPLVVEPCAPAVSNGLVPVVYGNVGDCYVVRPVGPIEVTRSDAATTDAFLSWEVTFRCQLRCDADLVMDSGVAAMTMKA